LDNIAEGAALLTQTLQIANSKILIVVDCDVDGFTSAAIIYQYIKLIEPHQDIEFILHEHKQHGLQDHYQKLLDNDFAYNLIILPDSSSNDYEYHEMIGELGSKFLILDHHEIDEGQKISKYACIINNQLSQSYPNKELTGAGVTWQFCRYYGTFINNDRYYADLIDLAALGICGDMGSVLNLENRFIMKNGFSNIQNYFFKSAIDK
jgi:single-stranded-DNA-specific exonuclease